MKCLKFIKPVLPGTTIDVVHLNFKSTKVKNTRYLKEEHVYTYEFLESESLLH